MTGGDGGQAGGSILVPWQRALPMVQGWRSAAACLQAGPSKSNDGVALRVVEEAVHAENEWAHGHRRDASHPPVS